MYTNELIKLIKDLDHDIEIENNQLNLDVRLLGLDSIQFIQFLAQLEEYFNIELDYDFLDKYSVVTIEILDHVIQGKKENET